MVTEVIDVIDFFDQIDDLIDFPPDNECSDANLVTPNYCKDFPTWDEALQYYDPLFSGGSVPYEDVMPLEWLSTFVEGSFSTLDNENMNTLQNQFQTSSPISSLESNSSSSSSCRAKAVPRAPQRARSKRPRPAPASSDSNNSAESPSMKKIKTTNEDDAPALVRKCSHCGVTKTPQWRAGPTGPKTLCNACGVRFKSGRLFPEYRPAASPTFVPALHSNSHKRVIEMRGKFATEVEPIPKASLLT